MNQDAIAVIDRIIQARGSESSLAEATAETLVSVPEIIGEIRDAYDRDWKKQKLTFARDFLSRTWGGIPLPVLSVCGRGTQEIRYSTYLAYFLDGSKPHGLGTRYLNGVLAFTGYGHVETYESVVETEKWLGQVPGRTKPVNCYCDIVITCDHYVVFIEQKIKSGESANPHSDDSQLRRYDMAITQNPEFEGMESVRIYLTPTGKESSRSREWKGLSYRDLATVGMNVLLAGGLSNTARENLKRFIMDLSLGPFDREESEILELIRLAEEATRGSCFADRLHFDQMVSRNDTLVRLLMEG